MKEQNDSPILRIHKVAGKNKQKKLFFKHTRPVAQSTLSDYSLINLKKISRAKINYLKYLINIKYINFIVHN